MSSRFMNVLDKDIRLMFWNGDDLISKFGIHGFIPQIGQVLFIPLGTHKYAGEGGNIKVKVLAVEISICTAMLGDTVPLDIDIVCEVLPRDWRSH